MERDLTDRVTVVTGAAAGIGLAMAEVFVRHGARLALVDRDPRVAETAEVIGGGARAYALDVSDAVSVTKTFEAIAADFGTIHVLVNNAGIGILGPAESLAVAGWDKTISVNLRGPFLCARAAAPFMLRQKWGRVVTIASQAAVIGIEGHLGWACPQAHIRSSTSNSRPENPRKRGLRPRVTTMAAERAFWHSTGVHNAKTLERAKAVCEGLSSEEILTSKGIPAAVSLLVGTAPAKASSR
jgi:NAD(P)-dependent dehydrogenase (short-subunit alcohol dehydrogenase family)